MRTVSDLQNIVIMPSADFTVREADGVTVGWQGTILGRTPEGFYLVQLYEWFVGMPSDRRLVPAADVRGWRFYGSCAAMTDCCCLLYCL